MMKIHNRYIIKIIDENQEVTKVAIGENTAYSANYLHQGNITTLSLIGVGKSKLIEPVPENEEDLTTYWYRSESPYFEDKWFRCSYRAEVYFTDIAGAGGTITALQLTSNSGYVISKTELKDIEGEPIYLTYAPTDTKIIVSIFIYFGIDMSKKETVVPYFSYYPITFNPPDASVFCGCTPYGQIDLLEIIERYDHKGHKVKDGYLPYIPNDYLGFSKNPIPLKDKNGYLMGAINDYVSLKNKNGSLWKNTLVTGIKGLVRALVFPGIGIIDLNDDQVKCGGPLREGILKGSLVKGQSICYVPEEYIASGKPQNPISISKNAFYKAPTVIVRRYRNDLYKEVPLHKALFSELILDKRYSRCESFFQHVPLTDYYCGAESIIPCAPSGGFIDEGADWYGYQVTYTGETTNKKGEKKFTQYLAATYMVVGEVIITFENGYSFKHTFNCVLEYSFNGNDFITAAEFTDEDQPYEKKYFNASHSTISAPIWRLRSTMNGRHMLAGHHTTHGDKNVSLISGESHSGYDPLFIFVGYKPNSSVVSIPDADPSLTSKSIATAKKITGDFLYSDSQDTGTMRVTKDFTTTVPYLYHENDCIYFNGSIVGGK